MPSDQVLEQRSENRARATVRSVDELAVSGMTCGNCARHVSEAIQRVPGVQSAAVSLEANSATVRWKTGAAQDLNAVVKAIEEEGYAARIMSADFQPDGQTRLSGWALNLWLGIPATLFLMVGEWVFGLAMTRWFQAVSFALSGMVQIFSGARFYRGAWGQLKTGNSNMDTLVALGSTTAFAYSAWAFFFAHEGHVYFMEAAAIITLVSVGHWIESRVSARASLALRNLLDLAPAIAIRRDAGGSETQVPVAELVPGDLVILRPGDRVPTDGEVVEGESAVDESMLTGESAPLDKVPGSVVYAGTTTSNGRLVMRVGATGEETALAQIIAAVQRAQDSRASIQRIGDRVSSVFVPVVVVVALGAGLWWSLALDSARSAHVWLEQFIWSSDLPQGSLAAGFIIAAAVLIIACPCAMGLATPAAIMAGSNAAARRGILIRDGVALEKAGRVTAVVFDKTGTLTAGRPSVAKAWVGHGNETDVLALAASLARFSSHPISNAVARLAAPAVEIAGWNEVRGAGVEGRIISGNPNLTSQARLGSLAWLQELGVNMESAGEFIQEWSSKGASLVGLALNESLLALLAVRDELKPGAAKVVSELQSAGLQIFLLTGDNKATAAAIAQQVGISPEAVFAEVRPGQKAEFIQKLQQQGRCIAFVGDGINDAPALEQADLGIAVSRASDIAREAADVILLNSDVHAVPESLGLARATLRTIKQNLFWAFFYNAVGIPLAALGFMSPVLCAAAMGLSDLVVIGNALRLTRWRTSSNRSQGAFVST
jgi:P-type Cu+ transporter